MTEISTVFLDEGMFRAGAEGILITGRLFFVTILIQSLVKVHFLSLL